MSMNDFGDISWSDTEHPTQGNIGEGFSGLQGSYLANIVYRKKSCIPMGNSCESEFLRGIDGVDLFASKEKVFGVHTQFVVPLRTVMTDALSFRDGSIMDNPRSHVRCDSWRIVPSYTDATVPVTFSSSSPNPTGLSFLNLRPEPVSESGSESGWKRGILPKGFAGCSLSLHDQGVFDCVALPVSHDAGAFLL